MHRETVLFARRCADDLVHTDRIENEEAAERARLGFMTGCASTALMDQCGRQIKGVVSREVDAVGIGWGRKDALACT